MLPKFLTRLEIKNNNLDNESIRCRYKITTLKTLNISGNFLTNMLKVQEIFPNLEYFYIKDNLIDFYNAITKNNMAIFRNLRHIEIHKNMDPHLSIVFIDNLPYLNSINIENNESYGDPILSHIFKNMKKMSNLKILIYAHNIMKIENNKIVDMKLIKSTFIAGIIIKYLSPKLKNRLIFTKSGVVYSYDYITTRPNYKNEIYYMSGPNKY